MARQPRPEELVARLSKRDASALADLYDQFAARLYRLLVRILADRAAAGDALHDVFLQLWSEARRLRQPPASVAAWLMLTARVTAVERLRSQRKLPIINRAKSIPLEKSASWLPSSEEIALLEERQELLRKVVNRLPDAQRRALELLVFEGYTETEIANKLGEPLGKAKSGLRAGLTFLRHRLRAVLGTWAANI